MLLMTEYSSNTRYTDSYIKGIMSVSMSMSLVILHVEVLGKRTECVCMRTTRAQACVSLVLRHYYVTITSLLRHVTECSSDNGKWTVVSNESPLMYHPLMKL